MRGGNGQDRLETRVSLKQGRPRIPFEVGPWEDEGGHGEDEGGHGEDEGGHGEGGSGRRVIFRAESRGRWWGVSTRDVRAPPPPSPDGGEHP